MFSHLKSTVLAALVVVGCRGPTAVATCDPPITAADRPLLEVKFAETLRIRGCSRATLHSETGAVLFGLRATLERTGVEKVQPMFSADAVAILERDGEQVSPGEPIPDLLSWHFLALAPGADTGAVLAVLRLRPEIADIYVHSEVVPPPPIGPNR